MPQLEPLDRQRVRVGSRTTFAHRYHCQRCGQTIHQVEGRIRVSDDQDSDGNVGTTLGANWPPGGWPA